MSLGSLIVSTAYMGLSCVLAQLARRLNERFTRQGLVQELINEAIAAAELCACCFELIIGKIRREPSPLLSSVLVGGDGLTCRTFVS